MRRAALCLLVGMALGGGAWFWVRASYEAPGPLTAASDIVIPKGTAAAIGAVLKDRGIVSDVFAFRVAALLTRGNGALRAGEWHFPAHAPLRLVLLVLREGKPVQHRITFPEGITASRIAELLAANDAIAGPVEVPPEGFVLPETYAFLRGTPAREILARAHQALLGKLGGVDALRARQILILASLVERESALPTERPMVARVFFNRLALGMRLQSDPATIYGASGGSGELGRALSHADLMRDDPYNSYVIPALPAGPICAPGAGSIAAVLHPAEGDALYFVANGNGGHVFAASLGEHNRNVTHYRERSRP
jgi:UPF0755 protein